MSFNGSGTFIRTDGTRSGSLVWTEADQAGVNIVTTDHDTHDQDLAAGLTNCITKDGQTTITSNIPLNSNKITGLGDATAAGDAVNAGQIQASAVTWGGTSGGSSNAYTLNLTPAPGAYVAGQRFVFAANHTATGTATLNVNGLGAIGIKIDGTGSNADGLTNDIISGNVVDVIYNGAVFVQQNIAYQKSTPAIGLASTGSVQGDALLLTTPVSQISVTASGTGVILPTAAVYRTFTISNRGANTLNVYPASGEAVIGQAINAAITVPSNAGAMMVPSEAGGWLHFATA